jgi:tetraacyldisaccharide 4'-kinase
MPSGEERYIRIISGEQRGPCAVAMRGLLTLAELPYRAAMATRNRLYDGGVCHSFDLGRPTISVGNITAGGTGKTPVVKWLASHLATSGRHPAILLRGYRRTDAGLSDEARLLANALPGVGVIANPDRIAGAQQALAQYPATDSFILDDGMQHRRARRNLELVLIHAGSPFGFGHVHPRGLLREPLSGLSRADAIILTHASEISAEAADRLQGTIGRYSNAPIFHADHVNTHLIAADTAARMPMEVLEQTRFVAFAGIGRPDSLERTLSATGRTFAAFERFPDHHAYAASDLAHLSAICRQHRAELLVTTEKDWVKLHALPRPAALPPILRLELAIAFWENEEQALLGLILRKLSEK